MVVGMSILVAISMSNVDLGAMLAPKREDRWMAKTFEKLRQAVGTGVAGLGGFLLLVVIVFGVSAPEFLTHAKFTSVAAPAVGAADLRSGGADPACHPEPDPSRIRGANDRLDHTRGDLVRGPFHAHPDGDKYPIGADPARGQSHLSPAVRGVFLIGVAVLRWTAAKLRQGHKEKG